MADCAAPADPIGVAVFRFDNEYLSGSARPSGRGRRRAHTLDIVDGQNSQPTQNEQIDLFITKDLPAIAVNQVDRELANVTLDKAKAADIPVVFFNKEPLPEVLATWDKAYYVGAKAEESGIMQGQLVIDYWNGASGGRQERRRHHPVRDALGSRRPPGRADPDGRVHQGHQRRRHRDRGARRGDRRLEPAPGHRADGRHLCPARDAIEFVLANNDNMAIGAVEALKANGYFGDTGKFMPVVGVDATEPALESMRAGELYGTVLNDAVNQAHGDVQPGLRARRWRHADRREHGLRHRRPVRLGALRPGRTRRPLGRARRSATRGAAGVPGRGRASRDDQPRRRQPAAATAAPTRPRRRCWPCAA